MGVQIHMELIDDDIGNDDFIDRFAIDLLTPVGSMIERSTYKGVFGLAEIDVSFSIMCTENFYGPNCSMLCLDNCTCEPGFTGEFCATSIDDCMGVECGLNHRCVDGHLNFSCKCHPGYTGPNCTIDIDECEGVDCNYGTCVNELASFSCTCNSGYTGEFCEAQLNGYELQVTIHSFRNPNGLCADQSCDRACCEGSCPDICDYYFSYCQRPIESPVSLQRLIGEGNCSIWNTLSYEHNDSAVFTDTVFGIPNPITITGLQWVSNEFANT